MTNTPAAARPADVRLADTADTVAVAADIAAVAAVAEAAGSADMVVDIEVDAAAHCSGNNLLPGKTPAYCQQPLRLQQQQRLFG
jgi:hypothetical protein